MYTIFKNDSSIILTDELKNQEASNFFHFNKLKLNDLLNGVEGNFGNIILYHQDMELMWKEFSTNFKVIEAAGGLVKNAKDEILFIYRNDKWDLPKGKIEKNENMEQAAVREVMEECGVDDVKIGEFIMKTYHIYQEKGSEILKVSYWYAMTCNATVFIPQLEEDITEVVWKNKGAIHHAMHNTYPNIKLLIENSQIGF